MTTNRKRSAKRLASFLLLGTGLLCFSACTSKQTPVNIAFSATWEGELLRCNDAATSLTDLRFFVSDVVLIDSAGEEHPILITSNDRWQQYDVALIDLENGEGGCLNGTQDVHAVLSGTAVTEDIEGIRLTVGVPFELNHANPLLAEPPLDDGAMHWHWRSGYKFLRAGVRTADDGFWIHLGSTACEGTVQNISTCRAPNRVVVQLSGFSPNTDGISVNLSRLFQGVDLSDQVRSDCSSGPSESACAAPFEALGLRFGEGSEAGTMQTVFQVSH